MLRFSLSAVGNPVNAIKDNVVLRKSSSVTVDGSGFDSIYGQQAKLPTIIIQTVGPYSVTATQGHGSSSSSTKISCICI
jgi:hypothetical protein